MLKGTIIHDGHDYSVKVGSVAVDISDEIVRSALAGVAGMPTAG